MAFTGIETNSPVVISTYGCIQGAENKRHFKAGLEAMVKTLEPSLVLVHGPMPEMVFSGVIDKSEFIQFPDWITRVKGGD